MKRLYQEPRFRRLAQKRRGKYLRRLARGLKNQNKFLVNGRYPRSHILEYLHQTIRGKVNLKREGSTVIVKIPKVFSFIDDPELAVDTIRSLSSLFSFKNYQLLIVDHSECKSMDLCASAALDITTLELVKEWKAEASYKGICGFYSRSKKVNTLLRCTGLVHHLKVKGEEPPPEVEANFLRFPLRSGYKPIVQNIGTTDQELAADHLARHFDACLGRFGFKLTVDGQVQIMQVVGEVIDNAERHSGRRKWWAMGCMDQNVNVRVGECALTIICFGRTIHQSLSEESSNPILNQSIADKTKEFTRRQSIFGRRPFTEENLWTLYALQDGVSRTSSPGSGSGTVKMIEAFQFLGQSGDPEKISKMTVISGSTRILFDGTYKMASGTRDGQPRQIIAMNASNSLDLPPDDNYVHSFSGFFPGTIISLRFFLNDDHLASL